LTAKPGIINGNGNKPLGMGENVTKKDTPAHLYHIPKICTLRIYKKLFKTITIGSGGSRDAVWVNARGPNVYGVPNFADRK